MQDAVICVTFTHNSAVRFRHERFKKYCHYYANDDQRCAVDLITVSMAEGLL